MLWLYATVIAALGFATLSLVANHIMRQTSSFDFAAIYSVLAAVFYLPVFLYFLPHYSFTPGDVMLAILVAGVANTGAIMTQSVSIKQGEVSTVIPLIRLQPVFAAVLGSLALGEALPLQKAAGILVVTAGGYLVLLKKNQIMEPLRQLKHGLAPKMAVLTAFLYSVGAVADRVATQQLSPRLYAFLIFVFMASGFLGYIGLRDRSRLETMKNSLSRHPYAYLLTGLTVVAAYYALFLALSLAEASIVVATLQVSILFSVTGGWLLFNEKGVSRKLIGSSLVIIGVALTVLEHGVAI